MIDQLRLPATGTDTASGAEVEEPPRTTRHVKFLATAIVFGAMHQAAKRLRTTTDLAELPHHLSQSSTEAREQDVKFRHQLQEILRRGRAQWFSDGMESELSKELAELLRADANGTIGTLIGFISGRHFNPEVLAESLNTVARHFPAGQRAAALWLLEHSLASPSSHVRDAAALGLAEFGDQTSGDALRSAIEREPLVILRKDLRHALDELERRLHAATSDHE